MTAQPAPFTDLLATDKFSFLAFLEGENEH